MRSCFNREFVSGRKYGLCVFLLFCLFVTRAQGAEYYAAPTGNDANDGSIDHPWQHIAWAAGYGEYKVGGSEVTIISANSKLLQQGDILYLRGGTYFEYEIDFKNSGTALLPITIKPWKNESAIVDGSGESSAIDSAGVFNLGHFWSSYSRTYIVLDGLTVQNGYDNGIDIGYNYTASHITIKNCTITGHRFVSGSNCGGIHCNRNFSCVDINKCKIVGDDTMNQNYSGVHLMRGDANVTISNCDISHCYNGIWYKHHQSTTGTRYPIFKNNFIYSNSTGIAANNDHCLVENNLIICKGAGDTGNGIIVWTNAGGPTGCYCTISHNTVYNARYTMGIACAGGGKDEDPFNFDIEGHYGGTANTVIDNVFYAVHEELSTFHIWMAANDTHKKHSEHATVSDYNCYYNSTGSNQFREFGNYYTFPQWQALYPSLDKHSVQDKPIFVNGSGTLAKINDYLLDDKSPGKGKASNGMDMGMDIGSVGLDGTVTNTTTAAAFSSDRLVVYPNPARIPKGSGKTVKLLNSDAGLEVNIYNSFGEKVRTLTNIQTITEWDAKTDTGEEAVMGTYFVVSGNKKSKIALIR